MFTCLLCRKQAADYFIPTCEHRYHENCLAVQVETWYCSACPYCKTPFHEAPGEMIEHLRRVAYHVNLHSMERCLTTDEMPDDPGLHRWLTEICAQTLSRYCNDPEKCQRKSGPMWTLDRVIRHVYGWLVVGNDADMKWRMAVAHRRLKHVKMPM